MPGGNEEFGGFGNNAAGAAKEATAPAGFPMNNKLILGTMNIIGDDTNPFQFEPNPKDVNTEYTNAVSQAGIAFDRLNISDVNEMVRGTENSHLGLLDKWNAYIEKQAFTDDPIVTKLCKEKKLDLSLDNKWTPGSIDHDGRFNPIVFALSNLPGDAQITQFKQACDNFDTCKNIILTYYNNKWPDAADAADDNESVEAKDAEIHKVASLLLWDLCCAKAVNEGKEEFTTMSQASYLLLPDGAVAPPFFLLSKLFAPLRAEVAKHPGALVIVGCQEMPNDTSTMGSVIPNKCKIIQNTNDVDVTYTGFVHSESLICTNWSQAIRNVFASTKGKKIIDDLDIKKKKLK
jgi:hypothetical protein